MSKFALALALGLLFIFTFLLGVKPGYTLAYALTLLFVLAWLWPRFVIRRIRLPDPQVLADSAVKQKAFLRHHPDALPQRANAEITNRSSVDQNLAAIELVEAREQIDHC